ncbi:MAG TPA: hypothetical protein PLF11_02135 [Bacillota bacterium]|nr:hypothetical protein [Bacillota bacterium]
MGGASVGGASVGGASVGGASVRRYVSASVRQWANEPPPLGVIVLMLVILISSQTPFTVTGIRRRDDD